MGWWKINSVECGQIDCSHKCPTNPQLVNAVPGRDAETRRRGVARTRRSQSKGQRP
jgi:hypothetical protein